MGTTTLGEAGARSAGAGPEPDDRVRIGWLGRLAAFSFRRRWLVLAAWLLAVVAAAGASSAVGGEFSADYAAKGSDSTAATDLLQERFAAQAGDTVDVAVRVEGGAETRQAEITALLAEIDAVPHVLSVDDPFATPGGVSADGTTVLAKARLDLVNPEDMPHDDGVALVEIAERAQADGFEVALGGQVVALAEQAEIGSEMIGLLAAAVILLLAFGSVIAAGLPILTAVLGLGVSSSLVLVLAAVMSVPEWSTALASMIGIGVGIDYVLLLVTRYREQLAAGREPLQAVVATAETAGRSVMVAGTTVVISMLGLFGMGLSYMRGAALSTILAVLVVMLASATAVPAMLGVLGKRVNGWRIPGMGRERAGHDGMWVRWSRRVQRRPVLGTVVGLVVLVLLALPFFGLRYGFPDAGNSAEETQVRKAYDMAATAFGPGANGPLLLAAELPADGSTSGLEQLRGTLEQTTGVAAVTPLNVNEEGSAAVFSVVPTTGPQDERTEDLVRTIRDDVIPGVAGGQQVHVGGVTAAAIDSTADVVKRLPLLVAGVVGLSMLLLLVAFRSVTVAIKAAVMNLLSIAAAYGVVALVLQGGWAGQLLGVDSPTPLPSFIPVLMFAILFGLSMDYEVFLLSRIRERWVATGDNSRSVVEGLAGTARVITAAAAIMVAVFAAFIPSPDVMLKVIGVGLATAIFIDATVVRMLLVPAVMQLLGKANWWMPKSFERLPNLHIEGRPEFHVGDAEPTVLVLPGQRKDQVAVK